MLSRAQTRCAVCGELKKVDCFGDGIKVPLTTCTYCYMVRQDKNKKEKDEYLKRQKKEI